MKTVKKVVKKLSDEGPAGLARAARTFATYHFRDKWQFVYLHFSLSDPIYSLTDSSLVVRRATIADRDTIETDIFPYLTGAESGDREYFDYLGATDPQCFLAESEGELVHYSWVFADAFRSPMTRVPIKQSQLQEGDGYIGPVFTRPVARGMVYLHVLPEILHYLKNINLKRVWVLVDGRNPSAASFYKRIGFTQL